MYGAHIFGWLGTGDKNIGGNDIDLGNIWKKEINIKCSNNQM